MNNKYTVFLILAIFIILFLLILQNNRNEHLDTSIPLSMEAIQNIASVYNKNNFIANNITSTGNITGDTIVSKNDIRATGPIRTDSSVNAGSDIRTNGSITAEGDIISNKGIIRAGEIRATGPLRTDSSVNAGGAIFTNDSINVGTNINTNDNGRICIGNICINKEMLQAIKVKAGYSALQI
jgi:hypothetical protein